MSSFMIEGERPATLAAYNCNNNGDAGNAILITCPQKVIYLAGPIHGLTYHEALAYREALEHHLSHPQLRFLSPMRNKERLGDNEVCGAAVDGHGPCYTAKGIVQRDLHDVRSCDAIVAAYTTGEAFSFGTAFEIGFATALGKPVILYLGAFQGDMLKHPFIEGGAMVVTRSVRETKQALHSLFAL